MEAGNALVSLGISLRDDVYFKGVSVIYVDRKKAPNYLTNYPAPKMIFTDNCQIKAFPESKTVF